MENADESYLQKWFRGLDIENAFKLSFETVDSSFRSIYDNWDDFSNGKPPLDLLKVWFRGMDVNRDHEVNIDEMKGFLCSLDKSMTVIGVAKEIRKIDRDGNSNGTINFYEFANHYGYKVKKNQDVWEGKGKSKCCLLL